jgi:hypothetical protein
MVLEGDRLDAALLVKAGGLIIVVGKLFRIADRLLGLTVVPRTGANLAFVGIGDPALLRQSQARQTGAVRPACLSAGGTGRTQRGCARENHRPPRRSSARRRSRDACWPLRPAFSNRLTPPEPGAACPPGRPFASPVCQASARPQRAFAAPRRELTPRHRRRPKCHRRSARASSVSLQCSLSLRAHGASDNEERQFFPVILAPSLPLRTWNEAEQGRRLQFAARQHRPMSAQYTTPSVTTGRCRFDATASDFLIRSGQSPVNPFCGIG